MTQQPNNVVKLSGRDWTGILSVAATLLIATLASYQHHDRKLTEHSIRLEYQQSQLERLTRDLESLEARLEKGTR